MLYHRVHQLQPDPWTLCVSPKNFAEQLEVISRVSPRPTVTFDDGYTYNPHNALPLLDRYDVPAQFFVVAGFLGGETEMWWDALDLVTPTESAYLEGFHHLRRLSFEPQEQEQELDAEFATRKLSRSARPGRRMMTQEEVALLAASPLAEIGAHTVTHPVLSQLSPETQNEEIKKSKRQLAEIINAPVYGFSYPNGTDADYTQETVELVRRAGFSYAYSAFEH